LLGPVFFFFPQTLRSASKHAPGAIPCPHVREALRAAAVVRVLRLLRPAVCSVPCEFRILTALIPRKSSVCRVNGYEKRLLDARFASSSPIAGPTFPPLIIWVFCRPLLTGPYRPWPSRPAPPSPASTSSRFLGPEHPPRAYTGPISIPEQQVAPVFFHGESAALTRPADYFLSPYHHTNSFRELCLSAFFDQLFRRPDCLVPAWAPGLRPSSASPHLSSPLATVRVFARPLVCPQPRASRFLQVPTGGPKQRPVHSPLNAHFSSTLKLFRPSALGSAAGTSKSASCAPPCSLLLRFADRTRVPPFPVSTRDIPPSPAPSLPPYGVSPLLPFPAKSYKYFVSFRALPPVQA